MNNLPNFIIVGVEKAGSTSIWNHLTNTDGIYMTKNKAPGYFHGEKYGKTCTRSEYLKMFELVKKEKVIGEATASYLVDPDSAELIHNDIPDAKIIILLRDPIERSFSHYLMYKSKGMENKEFHQIILQDKKRSKNAELFLNSSLYYDNIMRFVQKFGKEKIKIVIFEEFVENPEKVFSEILDFLDIKSNLPKSLYEKYGEYTESKSNITNKILKNKSIIRVSRVFPKPLRTKIKKEYFVKSKPEIDIEDKKILIEYYKEDVKKIQSYLKKKLPWNSYNTN